MCELEQSQEIDCRDTSIFDIEKYKYFAEEKMESLQEMVDVYKCASTDLQLRCILLEDTITQEFSISGNVGNTQFISKLEGDLKSSERARTTLEKEIIVLTSYNVTNKNRIEKLEGVHGSVDNTKLKIAKLDGDLEDRKSVV